MSLADLAADREARLGSRTFVQLHVQARYVAGPGDQAAVFRRMFPRSLELDRIERAFRTRGSVPAGGTDPGWAGPLATVGQMYAGAFTAALRPMTILGKLAYSPAPLNTLLPLFTSGAAPAKWTGQGKAIEVSRASLARTSLPIYKLATATMTTKELIESADVDATELLSRDLQGSVAQGRDEALLDPLLDEVELLRCASITFGAFTIPSSGSDAVAIQADAEALLAHLLAAGSDLTNAAFITSQAAGLLLGGLRLPSGVLAFPGASAVGGTLLGLPLICSASAGPQLVAVDAAQLAVADEGIETMTFSEGDVEVTVPPVGDALAPVGMTERISLFQTNSVLIRCLDFISWRMIRPDAVAVVSGFPEASADLLLTNKARRAA